LAPILKAKRELGVDSWLSVGLRGTVIGDTVRELAGLIIKSIGDNTIDPTSNVRYLAQTALAGYTANLMQPAYAKQLKGLSETELDQVLQSFSFRNCQPRQDILNILKKFWAY